MESLGRAVRLVQLFPSTQSLVIHHYILVCASLNSPSSLELQTLPSLFHHSVRPLYLPAAIAVDFIHSLALLYMNRPLLHTQAYAVLHSLHTQPPPQVSGVGCLFLRSTEVLLTGIKQVAAATDCTAVTFACNVLSFC